MKSTFELLLNTDNAAFQDDYITELESVFAGIIATLTADDYLNGKSKGLRDSNGNLVGWFKVTG